MRHWILPILALLLCLSPARAHDPKFSSVTLRLSAEGVRGTLVVPNARLKPGQPAPLPTLLADGAPVALSADQGAPDPDQPSTLFEVRAPWAHAPRRLQLAERLFADDPQSRTLVLIYEGSVLLRETQLDAAHPSLEHLLGGQSRSLGETVGAFLIAGTRHIFGEPSQLFVSDHVLFVLGLILLGGRLKQLLKIVTAFTLAHSITLALAATGVLAPSPRVIEPLIALSIVCIGVDNLLRRDGGADLRAPLAFGFGLVHGFGFAGALREAGLPQDGLAAALVAFNAGVEVGQGAIVVVAAPLLAWVARRWPSAGRRVLVGGSVGIALMGAWWFVARVTG